MAREVLLLLPILLLLSINDGRVQSQKVLSEDEITCIRQSRLESALERWLDCLYSIRSTDEQLRSNEQLAVDDIAFQPLQLMVDEKGEQLINDEQSAEDDIAFHPLQLIVDKEDAQSGEPAVMKKEPQNEPLTREEEITQKLIVDTQDEHIENKNTQNQRVGGERSHFQAQEFPIGRAQDKGGGHHYFPYAHRDNEDAAGASNCSNEEERATIEKRDMGDGAIFGWVKFNLGLVALGKLLSRMVWACRTERSNKVSPDVCARVLADDVLTATSKLEMASAPLKQQHGASHLQILGASLGSAVGAVLAELVLKMDSSLPADKISMILESALQELSILVKEDNKCSKLLEDFKTSFKRTYTMLYRIHQAGSPHDDRRDENFIHSARDTRCIDSERACSISNFQQSCSSVSVERCALARSVNDTLTRHPLPDTKHEKQVVMPLHLSSLGTKVQESVLRLDLLPEEHKSCGVMTDDGGETIKLGSSIVEQAIGLEGALPSRATSYGDESCNFVDKSFMSNPEVTIKEIVEALSSQPDYEVEEASSVCEEPSSIMQSGMVAFTRPSDRAAEYQKAFLSVFERHVQAQEQHNQLKYVEVKHLLKQRMLERERLRLTQDTNMLMRENIDLGRSKASFKEMTVLEKKAKDVYVTFSKTCADELAVGLFVMLASLFYSVSKYSVSLLNELVSTCQPSFKEPRRSSGFHVNWFFNSLDVLAGKLQTFVCQVTVSARILIGGILCILVGSVLLRRSVMSSSQVMPATVLIVVLGGVCGYVGKKSVDSLGGNGARWCIMWEIFCFVHAFSSCFSPFVYNLINGPPSSRKARCWPPFWIRRLAFHLTLLLVLPGLAGQLPFGSFYQVLTDLYLATIEIWSSLCFGIIEWALPFIRKSHGFLVKYIQ